MNQTRRPLVVKEISFGYERKYRSVCEVEGCYNRTFIRCAHCGKHLCLHHFMKRTCFHDSRSNENAFRTGIHIEGNPELFPLEEVIMEDDAIYMSEEDPDPVDLDDEDFD